MTKSEMYRQYAEQCFKLAETAETPGRRAFLMEMAQAWHAMAQEQDWAEWSTEPTKSEPE
jgi:hypothetical protein